MTTTAGRLESADHAVSAVQGAIQVPSVFGEEVAVGDYLANLMEELGYSVEQQPVAPRRFNVLGRLETGRPGPTILLQGHMDTVPAGEHPEPFSGAVHDDAIWGRGATDMKGPLVAGILAGAEAWTMFPQMCGTVIVAATVDEESEKRGIFALVDSNVHADFGICLEPTDLRVAIAQKGCVSMRVTTHGVAAHGANPELGVNAIRKMATVVEAIESASVPEIELAGIGNVRGSYNVGVISGGEMFFIVPSSCSIWVDRRTVPGETQSEALARLRELVESVEPQAEVLVDRQDWNWDRIRKRGIGSCSVDPSSPVVLAVESATRAVTGEPPTRIVQSAWCETDFLVNDLGIPTVNFGPGRMELAHTTIEHIPIASLLQGVEILARAIGELCAP